MADEQAPEYERHFTLLKENYDFGTEENKNLCSWLEANGVNPHDVPMNQVINVDADHIELVKFSRHPEGTKIVEPGGFRKVFARVPHTHRPENFNL